MLKIWACSDIHEEFDSSVFIPPDDENIDLIVCAGDMTNYGYKDNKPIKMLDRWFEEDEVKSESIALAKQWLKKCSRVAPVAYIPGNHDWHVDRQQLYKGNYGNIRRHEVFNVLESSLNYWLNQPKTTTVTGFSLSTCFNLPVLAVDWDRMTADPKTEKNYYELYSSNNLDEVRDRFNIWVSHSPPTGVTGTCRNFGDIGAPSLREAIEEYQPELVICGHVHEPVSTFEQIGKTKVYNVARRSQIIELEI